MMWPKGQSVACRVSKYTRCARNGMGNLARMRACVSFGRNGKCSFRLKFSRRKKIGDVGWKQIKHNGGVNSRRRGQSRHITVCLSIRSVKIFRECYCFPRSWRGGSGKVFIDCCERRPSIAGTGEPLLVALVALD